MSYKALTMVATCSECMNLALPCSIDTCITFAGSAKRAYYYEKSPSSNRVVDGATKTRNDE